MAHGGVRHREEELECNPPTPLREDLRSITNADKPHASYGWSGTPATSLGVSPCVGTGNFEVLSRRLFEHGDGLPFEGRAFLSKQDAMIDETCERDMARRFGPSPGRLRPVWMRRRMAKPIWSFVERLRVDRVLWMLGGSFEDGC